MEIIKLAGGVTELSLPVTVVQSSRVNISYLYLPLIYFYAVMRSRVFCMPSKVSLTELLHTLAPDSFAVFPKVML